MKIVVTFPGCHRRGGVERIVWECARFLAGRDHDVHVFANEWEKEMEAVVQFHRVEMRRHPNFLAGQSFFEQCTHALKKFDV